jgi:hypothetical protein
MHYQMLTVLAEEQDLGCVPVQRFPNAAQEFVEQRRRGEMRKGHVGNGLEVLELAGNLLSLGPRCLLSGR